MNSFSNLRQRQSGAYLLEALIGILIFALGVLGIVGLQAASLKTTNDAGVRAEAVFAASQLLGQMWTDNVNNLSLYTDPVAGPPYLDFAAQLKAAQGGAWAVDPKVRLDDFAAAPPSNTSHSVTITIYWHSDTATEACPAPAAATTCHNYTTSGVIAKN